jgi:hypothetical protein
MFEEGTKKAVHPGYNHGPLSAGNPTGKRRFKGRHREPAIPMSLTLQKARGNPTDSAGEGHVNSGLGAMKKGKSLGTGVSLMPTLLSNAALNLPTPTPTSDPRKLSLQGTTNGRHAALCYHLSCRCPKEVGIARLGQSLQCRPSGFLDSARRNHALHTFWVEYAPEGFLLQERACLKIKLR